MNKSHTHNCVCVNVNMYVHMYKTLSTTGTVQTKWESRRCKTVQVVSCDIINTINQNNWDINALDRVRHSDL